ncbi:MAG: large conductance mechanosensitive channel protein MscL [Anaerolineae bacterium]|nr:large conductance mechanosensitive channel protein MscL [Anaerolineae bacterium]
MLKEFREFAMRGNVLDLAVGIILGAAFGSIVNSLVNDVIMPPIGLLLGGVDFSNLYINLSGGEYASLAAAREAGASVIAYGAFLNTIINFIIVAFAVFLLVKGFNEAQKRGKKQEEAKPAEPAKPEPMLVATQELTEAVKKLTSTMQK